MRHVLYEGDVHGGEAVTELDVKPLRVVREKTAEGRYQIVATDEPEDAAPDAPAPKKAKGK